MVVPDVMILNSIDDFIAVVVRNCQFAYLSNPRGWENIDSSDLTYELHDVLMLPYKLFHCQKI